MPRFDLKCFMKKRKEMRERQIMVNRNIKEASQELVRVENKLELKTKELDAKEHKHSRLDEKVGKVVRKIEELDQIEKELNYVPPNKKIKSDRRTSTDIKDGKLNLSNATARRRRKELYQAAEAIHGSSQTSADIGLADTLVNKCSVTTINNVFSARSQFNKNVVSTLHKPHLVNYEKSDSNMIRSVSTYYSGGVMGKLKYRSVYRNTSYAKGKRITVNDCAIPRLVPYNRLMPFIKNIDIGKLHSVRETLCQNMEEEEKINGVYRSLKEMLLKLAEFYLNQTVHKLIWFNGQTNRFFVALGGDGAPFGKDDVSCSWLISFLNLGRGVLSSHENFLLFGANCTENSLPVQRFIKLLVVEMKEVEKSTHSVIVNGSPVNISFQFAELPNDMKMLSFLAGELSNSAKYFSSFANVSSDNSKNILGSFSLGCGSTWTPWDYEHRLRVSQKVDSLKKTLSKSKLAPATQRTKITTFISSQKSRQEFPPPIGKLIDCAHVEPLHVKNNACALAHRLLLHEVMYMSDISASIKTFSMVPCHSPFFKYITSMRTSCNLRRLSKKIIRWFDETKATGKDMDYRFTGKDSKMFLHHFNQLIQSVLPSAVATQRQLVILHIISYMCLCLRDCVSLFNRLELNQEQVSQLKTLCHHYFSLNYLYLHSVNPTVWHIGYVVPIHTEDMCSKYGMGLSLNSMEGREAKHISISCYSKNTIFQYRWEQVFLHEYVSLVWLRERGYNWNKQAMAKSTSYIPKTAEHPDHCTCGLLKMQGKNTCSICGHRYMEKIKLSIQLGKSLFGEIKLKT